MTTGNDQNDFNRREFIKGGSAATLMTLLGGVPLLAQPAAAPASESVPVGPRIKCAVIGLGAWGRDIVTALSRIPFAEVAAICDTYPASLRRSASIAPAATQTDDYQTILANKEIKAVIVATPTHQ